MTPIRKKLDRYIKNTYRRSLLRGFCFTLALLPVLFLLLVFLEHFFHFSTSVRFALLAGFVTVAALSVFRRVLPPIAALVNHSPATAEKDAQNAHLRWIYRFAKVSPLSYRQAAAMIGRENPEIADRLLNLVELESYPNTLDTDLLEAAIEQRSEALVAHPFSEEQKKSRSFPFRYLLPLPYLLVVLLLLLSPNSFRAPASRLLHPNSVAPAPFSITLDDTNPSTPEGQDYQLNISISGHTLPRSVSIRIGNVDHVMRRVDPTHFSYVFHNPRKTTQFSLSAPGYDSPVYSLTVFPRPELRQVVLTVTPPSYTGLPERSYPDPAPITVPEGSKLNWTIRTANVDTLFIVSPTARLSLIPNSPGQITHSFIPSQSESYALIPHNESHCVPDTIVYDLAIQQDMYPQIDASQYDDSLGLNRVIVQGRIGDDYGFSRLEFQLWRKNPGDTAWMLLSCDKLVINNQLQQDFAYEIPLAAFVANPGDQIRYRFEVWDNDSRHHFKSAHTPFFYFNNPTEEERARAMEAHQQSQQRQGKQLESELQQIMRDIEELQRRLIDESELKWNDKKQIENLLKRQEEINRQLKEMQRQLQNEIRNESLQLNSDQQKSEERQQMEELLKQFNDENLEKQMEQMRQMLEQNQKDKIQQHLEEMRRSDQLMEQKIDQDMDLLLRQNLENRVEEVINRTDRLAEKQRQLSTETENASPKDKQMLHEKQQKLSTEFQDIKKELEKLHNEYKDLDPSSDFKPDKSIQQSVEQKQQDAEGNIQKGKNKEASQQQKQAAEEMEKLSEQIAEAQMEMDQSDLAEDSESIRRLLKNVLRLSFNQESLVNTLNTIYVQDPKYQQTILEQNKIREDFRNVQDSLQQIAKRQLAVASVINKELASVNTNIDKSLDCLLQYNQSFYSNYRNSSASRFMQSSMTSFNNLALIMAESLDKMQNQMRQNQQQQKQGNCKRKSNQQKQGQCSKPGSGKPSPKSMRQLQDQLNKQMEALKKELEKQGKNGNQQKPGRTKIGESGQMSEEFARMAAEQERIRRMMQEYGQELKQQNGGNSKLAKEIDQLLRQMEQTETDLVNKIITQQTITRQQQILSRLLQHEKADLQREKEDRRESHEASDILQSSPKQIVPSNKSKDANEELYQTVPPALNDYYKRKVSAYFND